MDVRRFGVRRILAVASWITLSSAPGLAGGCPQAPVVFAYQGSLYAVPAGGQAHVIVSGFTAPNEIRWAPNCGRYAFIDEGTLWVAEPGAKPAQVITPGTVSGYDWAPNGETIGFLAQRPACGGGKFPGNVVNQLVTGDVFLVGIPQLDVKALTADCGSSWLGWSPDSNELLLLGKAPTPSCAAKTPPGMAVDPPCAQHDLLIWDAASGRTKSVITAEQLNREELEPGNLVAWDGSRGLLYLWSRNTWTGGGYVFAIDIASGNVLWRHACYHNATSLGNNLIGINEKVWVQAMEGTQFQSTILNSSGQVVQQFPPSLDADNWPSPEGFRLRLEGARLAFLTNAGNEAWVYNLPDDFQWGRVAWTPKREVCVVAWKGKSNPTELEMGLWLLNPTKHLGSKLFEGTIPEPNGTIPLMQLANGGAVQPAVGYSRRVVPPLVVATWPHTSK